MVLGVERMIGRFQGPREGFFVRGNGRPLRTSASANLGWPTGISKSLLILACFASFRASIPFLISYIFGSHQAQVVDAEKKTSKAKHAAHGLGFLLRKTRDRLEQAR